MTTQIALAESNTASQASAPPSPASPTIQQPFSQPPSQFSRSPRPLSPSLTQ